MTLQTNPRKGTNPMTLTGPDQQLLQTAYDAATGTNEERHRTAKTALELAPALHTNAVNPIYATELLPILEAT